MLDSRFVVKPQQLVKSEYETLAAFRYALRQFLRFSEAAAQEVGITAQQHQALLAVKGFLDRDRVTVGELAEKLVIRAPSAADRRQVLIQLTDRGERILERLAAVHRQQLQRIGPEIRQLLGRLCGAEE
jgi:DNA-binding MarR family transcriptional regulator